VGAAGWTAGQFFLVTYDLRGFGASAPMDPVCRTHADDLFRCSIIWAGPRW
jgi:hypothetical protein